MNKLIIIFELKLYLNILYNLNYNKDWLNHQTIDFTPLMTNISLGKTWLTQMARAASHYNMTIQYCMSLSRHVMSSLEHDSVTQVRV
jgi:hypothetical protein